VICINDSDNGQTYEQGGHLSGKPGNVKEFDSHQGTCQELVGDFSKGQGNVTEVSVKKSCQGKVA